MKILFVTLSNIGDCLLTLPALDYLKSVFPQARITCLTAERSKEIFEGSSQVERIIVYDKRAGAGEKIKLFFSFWNEHFDLVVDLRNTLFGALLQSGIKRLTVLKRVSAQGHMKDRHLSRALLPRRPAANIAASSLRMGPEDEQYAAKVLKDNGIAGNDFIVIAPGARSHIKRWPKENFLQLCLKFHDIGLKTVLVGDDEDKPVCAFIEQGSGKRAFNLCAKTTIRQLAALLKKARLVVTNDSAVMHLASYLNRPLLAIFGPTNEDKYGPWSGEKRIAKKEIFCRPCEKAQCRFGTLACMSLIKPDEVWREALALLKRESTRKPGQKRAFKRILIVRGDRIGDVLISTPVIKAIRDAYAHSYLAMMVSPRCRQLLEANPYLDEVIVYDKDKKHRGWLATFKFSRRLKKKKFDLAVVLHPANRAHLVVYLAGIPMRIGWRRKLGFLLTHSLEHAKQEGRKHESEYNMDVLKLAGIEATDKDLFMAVLPQDERWAEELLLREGIKGPEALLAVHPGASCISKLWPPERFARAADELARIYGFKILLVSAPEEAELCRKVKESMRTEALDLGGRTSLRQLAALLKKCRLFISNDSGPVHIACAVGTPVISIFGRNQKGLSPLRWGPSGKKDKALHKEVGCRECLAHNCRRDFACLKAISVEDVLRAARQILCGDI